jgi:hypothetical protein
MRKVLLYLSFSLIFSLFFSCKKDKILMDSSAKISFSQDSVLFDTIFTTVGSTTRYFKVYNNNNQKINISKIYLAGGTSSPYRFNADGLYGKTVENIEIDANDSVFVFVEVTVNPNSGNSPLVIRDSLVFEINGNLQDVDLEAWGQDAYFHLPDNKIVFQNGGALYYGIEPCTTTWLADKPHVVYGYRVVDSACVLTVDPGTNIYFHNNGGVWVYRYGTIKVNGSFSQPVSFQGDRLEPEYADVPGQWDRIWINEGSVNNVINYAVIKNGFIGIQHEVISNAADPMKLVVSNTIIQNMSGWGMFAIHGNIIGYNNLVCNCGKNLAAFLLGGKYRFYQCTFANFYSEEDRTDPVLFINNYDNTNGMIPVDSAYFGNCIIDGANEDEIALDSSSSGGGFNFFFENCELKTKFNTSGSRFINCRVNQFNAFGNTATYNFNINSNSDAIGRGKAAIGAAYPTDLDNQPRDPSTPDIGAYEFH